MGFSTPTGANMAMQQQQAANQQVMQQPGYQNNIQSFAAQHPGIKNWLFGGNASGLIQTRPEDMSYAQGVVRQNLANGQAPQLNDQYQLQSRDQMNQLAQRLGLVAAGQAPGAGEMAINRQVGQAQAAQMAQANMARGANAMLANREAARNNVNLGVGGAGQAAIAQMQDQQNANAALGGLLGNMRQGDIGVAGQNAQLTQQQGAVNQGWLNSLLGYDAAQQQAQQAKAGVMKDDKGTFGGILGTVGGMLAMSDERTKTDIKPAGGDVDEMLSELKPYSYNYKDTKYGLGERLGIMAQDLEKSKMGSKLTVDMDGYRGVDLSKAVSASLAGLARLHERLGLLEKGK